MFDDELNQLTERIIGCAYAVSNSLGSGFLEKVYENALLHELRLSGVSAESQVPMQVKYRGVVIGDFFVDLLISNTVIVEVKATKEDHDVFTAQCLNYLKASGKPLCLLINFGKARVDVKRLRSPRK